MMRLGKHFSRQHSTSKSKTATIVRSSKDSSITLHSHRINCSLIWLHGLGGTAEAYLPFWRHRSSAVHEGCRVKIIQAPERWVTLNQTRCNSWYNVRSANRFTQPVDEVFDLEQVQESYDFVDRYVESQVYWWKNQEDLEQKQAAKRVFVGGMSQGGVMSLHYALSSRFQLGGAIALSAYMLVTTRLANLGQLPLLLVHGGKDKTILQTEAKNSYGRVLEHSLVDYHSIPKLQHSICFEEIRMIREWIGVTNSLHELNH